MAVSRRERIHFEDQAQSAVETINFYVTGQL